MDNFKLTKADDKSPWMTITSMSYKKRSSSAGLLTAEERIRGASTLMHASLPLPIQLAITTDFDWSEESMSLVQTGGAAAVDSDFDMESMKRAVSGLGLRIADAALEKFGSRIIAQEQGRAADPMKEIFFNGVSYRKHTWAWFFQPKNATEAQAVYEFCQTIERAATASRSAELSSYFDIPDSFRIEFAPWLKLPAIPECVCTSVTVDYFGAGAAIFHSDGYAAYVGLQASFLETVLPLKG